MRTKRVSRDDMVWLVVWGICGVILAPESGGFWDLNVSEWVALIVLLPSAVVGLYRFFWIRWWQARQPFHVRVAEWNVRGFDDPPVDRTPVRRSLSIRTHNDRGAVLIRVTPRGHQPLYFAVRFEHRVWFSRSWPFLWRWEEDASCPLEMGDIDDFGFTNDIDWRVTAWDEKGVTGPRLRRGQASPQAISGEHCWMVMAFRAERRWKGYLAIYGSLRHARAEEHVVRRRLNIRVGRFLP